jgi:hypothetical protein
MLSARGFGRVVPGAERDIVPERVRSRPEEASRLVGAGPGVDPDVAEIPGELGFHMRARGRIERLPIPCRKRVPDDRRNGAGWAIRASEGCEDLADCPVAGGALEFRDSRA